MTTYKEPTELDRAALRAMGHRIPNGCDQQGRYPEAAEAATELGADDRAIKPDNWEPIIGARPLAIFILATLALVACAAVVVLAR